MSLYTYILLKSSELNIYSALLCSVGHSRSSRGINFGFKHKVLSVSNFVFMCHYIPIYYLICTKSSELNIYELNIYKGNISQILTKFERII